VTKAATTQPGATIRVVIADDQPLVRTGLAALIASAPDVAVVGEAGDGREAVRLARAAQADVVLMDIRMPVLDGLEATRLITGNEDLAGVKVLILTTFEIDEYIFAALRAGASGFLGKSAEADELIAAIRTVSRGDALLSPAATRSLIARFLTTPSPPPMDEATRRGLAALTDREREITVLVATGLSNEEIAARLVLSPATVKTHVNHAMVKAVARDRAQLVVFAHRSGLIELRQRPALTLAGAVCPSAPRLAPPAARRCGTAVRPARRRRGRGRPPGTASRVPRRGRPRERG
jgi:DNA-binding NarL/FixJ family response regulator